MKYDFDEVIDRHNTDAIKIERCKTLFGTEDVLPLWVADMDFRTPDFILNAIQKRLEHPILGYSNPPEGFFPSIIKWTREHHDWDVEPDWVGFVPGVVTGICFAIQAFSAEGDEVIIQPPVYYPFIHTVKKNNRQLVFNPLKIENNQFEMDLDDLEKKITPKTRMLIMSNPHNPGGRVWSKECLKKLSDICFKNNILVISDEIHADMTLYDHQHIPFATVSEQAASNSITFNAPSKTFNIPGLISSYYIIPNTGLRKKYYESLDKVEVYGGNIFAYAATQSAYEQGEEWRKQMLEYVQANIDYIVGFLAENIPQIKPMIPDASYLVWLDCSQLGFETTKDLSRFFIDKAGLGLNPGTSFGPGGEQHLRINIACSRGVLEKAMSQLLKAVKERK